jgi:hypothetical protein
MGTVKSRLARARERLRAALRRRGLGPSAVPPTIIENLAASSGGPPLSLTASTIRNSVVFATDPIQAAIDVSKSAYLLAGGVLQTMIRAKLLITTLRTVAALGLVVTAWVAYAGQAVVDRPKVEAPAAGPNTAVRTVDLDGNWIIRGYPSAEAVGLIKIEGSPRQAHATLLSIMMPDRYRFAESRVEPFGIDAETVRFTLEFTASRAIDSRTFGIVTTRSCCVKNRARPPSGSTRPLASRNGRSMSITPGWAPASSRS